jgi:hypothetical protein
MRNSLFGRILIFIVGIVMLGVSAFAIYSGHISSFGRHVRHHTILRAIDPNTFWFNVILYAVLGAFALYSSLRQ